MFSSVSLSIRFQCSRFQLLLWYHFKRQVFLFLLCFMPNHDSLLHACNFFHSILLFTLSCVLLCFFTVSIDISVLHSTFNSIFIFTNRPKRTNCREQFWARQTRWWFRKCLSILLFYLYLLLMSSSRANIPKWNIPEETKQTGEWSDQALMIVDTSN